MRRLNSLRTHSEFYGLRFLKVFCILSFPLQVLYRDNIFQGPKTNRRSVLDVREAIPEERDIQISLLNYKKDGTPFSMLFHMCPVFYERNGRLIHFLGVQVPILRRPKPSRVGLNLCQDGAGCLESVLRCYRRDVYSMSVERELSLASGSGLDFAGFSKNEVLGYNCRSFSSTNTDLSSQFRIKECLRNEQPSALRMLNYRFAPVSKRLTSFWRHISPVRNASGKIAYFVAVEGEDNSENQVLRQRGVVAAVKVAVRGLSMGVTTC